MSINDIIYEALTLKLNEKYLIIDRLMSSLSEAKDDLSHLEKEVEKVLSSKLSDKSHKEIFQNLN